ncbi:AP-2 complex subunit mu [Glycine soja]
MDGFFNDKKHSRETHVPSKCIAERGWGVAVLVCGVPKTLTRHSPTFLHFVALLLLFSVDDVCLLLLLLEATDLLRSYRILYFFFFFCKLLRRRIWNLIHWIGYAGGCFRYILLEPPRRRSHQSPLPGRCRLYRGNMVDAFRTHIMQTKELGTCPVKQIGGCSFFYMRISNVYIVIVVSSNANVACAFKFVVEAVALFKSYFGGAFDEDAIRNNFVLIYELLDEIMDFGYPQNLSPEILKLYITQEGVRSPFSSKPSDRPIPNATLQVTGAVGWRREGLVYKKNEVFLDIVESVNLLMSSKGVVLRCDVTGKVLMKCFLSGMPDLKLGLNDKIGLEKESQLKSRPTKSGKTIELDDVTFHQCVNLTRFNSEKTVSFVPPDGEFELMKYRITEGVNLPFKVLPTIKELGRTRMEVNVKVKSVFGAKMFALGVVVKIPVPKHTAKTSFTVTSGRAKYNASIDCLVWKIRKFPGQTEPTLSAEIELISTMTEKKSSTRPPIQMEFQVPMFTASGLRVRFLKVWEKSGYNTVEWVRYITKAGSYEVRC